MAAMNASTSSRVVETSGSPASATWEIAADAVDPPVAVAAAPPVEAVWAGPVICGVQSSLTRVAKRIGSSSSHSLFLCFSNKLEGKRFKNI